MTIDERIDALLDECGITPGPWGFAHKSTRGNPTGLWWVLTEKRGITSSLGEPNARLIAQSREMVKALIKDAFASHLRDTDNPMYHGSPPVRHKDIIESATGKSWSWLQERLNDEN